MMAIVIFIAGLFNDAGCSLNYIKIVYSRAHLIVGDQWNCSIVVPWCAFIVFFSSFLSSFLLISIALTVHCSLTQSMRFSVLIVFVEFIHKFIGFVNRHKFSMTHTLEIRTPKYLRKFSHCFLDHHRPKCIDTGWTKYQQQQMKLSVYRTRQRHWVSERNRIFKQHGEHTGIHTQTNSHRHIHVCQNTSSYRWLTSTNSLFFAFLLSFFLSFRKRFRWVKRNLCFNVLGILVFYKIMFMNAHSNVDEDALGHTHTHTRTRTWIEKCKYAIWNCLWWRLIFQFSFRFYFSSFQLKIFLVFFL